MCKTSLLWLKNLKLHIEHVALSKDHLLTLHEYVRCADLRVGVGCWLVLLLRWCCGWGDSAARHRNQTLTGGGVELGLAPCWRRVGRRRQDQRSRSPAQPQHSTTPQHKTPQHHTTPPLYTTTLHHYTPQLSTTLHHKAPQLHNTPP